MMKNLRKNSGKTTGMEEPTLNPSRREGLRRPRKVKKAPSLREGRGWVIPPHIAAFRTWISAQVGCAPSEEAYLLSESATMLISRWLVNVSGISAISTKTSWSGSLLITDFRNRNDGRVLARLSVRGDFHPCQKSSAPSLKALVAGSMEMQTQLPELWTLLNGIFPVGARPLVAGLTTPSGSLSALTSPSLPVSMAYWQLEACGEHCSVVAI